MSVPAKKLLVLLDCCHASGIFLRSEPKARPLIRQGIPVDWNMLANRGRGTVVIASSRANEVSLTGVPYSVFTFALAEAFSGIGTAEEDGYVRAADLALHARERIPVLTNQAQHPTLHFERADNFAVAYYAASEKKVKGVPNSFRSSTLSAPAVSLNGAIEMLRALVKKVWHDGREVRVIAQDLDLVDANIHFNDAPDVFWNELLNAAHNRDRMSNLFARLDRDFERNSDWVKAKQIYWQVWHLRTDTKGELVYLDDRRVVSIESRAAHGGSSGSTSGLQDDAVRRPWRELHAELQRVSFDAADWRDLALETDELRTLLVNQVDGLPDFPAHAANAAHELLSTLESATSPAGSAAERRTDCEHAQQLKNWILELLDPLQF